MLDMTFISFVFGSLVGLTFLAVRFYNYGDSPAMLYTGWALLALGIVLLASHVVLRTRGQVAKGGSYLATTVLVNSGVYGIVRHPIYLSFMVMAVALVFLAQITAGVILGVISLGLIYMMMLGEEQFNLRKFGDEYQAYMQEVPRLNLIVGVVRAIVRSSQVKREQGKHGVPSTPSLPSTQGSSKVKREQGKHGARRR